jgi:uncharacterized membrane protein YczE
MQTLHAQLFGLVLVLVGVLLLGLKGTSPEVLAKFKFGSLWTDSYVPALIVLTFGVIILAYGVWAEMQAA